MRFAHFAITSFTITAFAVALVVLLPAERSFAVDQDSAPATFPVPNYTTSWLGNSYGGPDWVQHYVDDLCTTPDGACYLAAPWDEGAHEVGIYKDGKVIGAAASTHGVYGGEMAVTANSKYLYIAQSLRHLGKSETGAVYPPDGTNWYGVGRRNLDGTAAPFPGGKGGGATPADGMFLVINTDPIKVHADITSLAASDTQLFVANGSAGEIQVYDAQSMARTGSFPLPGVLKIAYDPTYQSLWAIQKNDAGFIVRHLHGNGEKILPDLELPKDAVPRSICVGPQGQVLVGDDGPAQQVLVYADTNVGKPGEVWNGPVPATFPPTGAIGVKGGIFSDVPGRAGPLKFKNPVGVGMDRNGNVYVAMDQGGTVLESYSPAPDYKLNWQLHGLEFTDCADLDPGSPDDVYTPSHHYQLDLSKSSGKEATYASYLVDPFGFPDDPRINGYPCVSTFVRRIQGKPFLFGLDMNASLLQIYRFTGKGDLTALAGLYRVGGWSQAKGSRFPAGGFIWRDASGSGKFDDADFEKAANLPNPAWAIDENGGIWTAFCAWENHVGHWNIRHIPCRGLDGQGNPIYSFKDAVDAPALPPFDLQQQNNLGAKIERLEYAPKTDTLYVSGFTAEHPDAHKDWKTSGPVIARYDHWTTKPAKTWQIDVAFESAQTPGSTHVTPDALSVAGDKLFNGYLRKGEIRVYNTSDGSYQGSLLPGPEVNSMSGWIDTMYGVRARQLANGDYLVFAEEVLHQKTLMYRLKSPHAESAGAGN